jgi:polysaccharide export outer membrane protein
MTALTMIGILGGCSTLSRDGPTGRSIERGASTANADNAYVIADLDYATSELIRAMPNQFLGSLASGASTEPGGVIGAGDVLAISIFEANGSLFSSGGSSSNSNSGSGSRGSSQGLPLIAVDTSGAINLPFAGQVQVAGLSSAQAATAIRRALAGKVANPQVIVSVAENSFNTVTVLGEVKEPGRASLATNADRIVDVIADRGGAARAPEDVQIRIGRNGQTFTAPLTAVLTDFNENIRLMRGDQVNLVYKPRKFSTFGALGQVSQIEMGAGPVTLAGALSKVGGLDTNYANARSVLIFRFERPEIADALHISQRPTARGVPVVYRLNLEEAEGLFIASNFIIQPDDIIYVPRSSSAELGKFFTLIRSISGVVYDISVTNTLNNN